MSLSTYPMRLSSIQTGTKIFGAFAAVSAAIVVICAVALWRMAAADALTHELVEKRLARQQLTSELLGMARLNGTHAVAIARSDSLEAADYFQARLSQGDKDEAALQTRLDTPASKPDERTLMARAASARAAYLAVRKQVFQAKDLGRTVEVEQLASNAMARTFDAYTASLEALLAHQTREARAMAAASSGASTFSQLLLLGVGGAAARRRRRLAAHARHRRALAGGGAAGRARREGRSEHQHRARARRRNRAPVRRPEPHDGRRVRDRGEGARQRAHDRPRLGRHRGRQPRPVAPHRAPGREPAHHRALDGRAA
jgi:hypothetical protein